ncbi:hypothetical protein [Brazilian marseillevirus]|uniref:hypothetical protein n=1 Tax=Brazilian marseillevirus TaxID=1813599 RepID=UPI00078135A7|nr:hypothetical protein A3303_gp464 [Brazilian marseillevirus]AMQ10972.1 hypothetical protein [Brazilian marseillevirus]
MSFQVISSSDPNVLPGVFYNLGELMEVMNQQAPENDEDQIPELIDDPNDELPELIDVPNNEFETTEGGDFTDDEVGEERLDALRTQIFQLSGYDECFNNLCPCGSCDEYRGQPLVYHKATFKHPIETEDFSGYRRFDWYNYF